MMGFSDDNKSFSDLHLHPSNEQMESLILDDDDHQNNTNKNTFSDFRSNAISTLSDTTTHQNHPLLSSSQSPRSSSSSPTVIGTSDYSLNPNSYLEPPSYADVIFSPFDTNNVSNGDGENGEKGFESPHADGLSNPSLGPFSSSTSSYSSTLLSEYLNITVSSPQKEQEESNSLVPGGSTYVTYLVTTRTNMEGFGGEHGGEFNVRRRFRDVVTLSDRLAENYRGYFIPARPDKSVVESQVMQKQEFVEQRRVALEKYLCRLAVHPVIRKSDELRVFLQVQGKLPLVSSVDVASRMLDGAVKLPSQLFGGGGESAVGVNEVVQPAKGGRDLLRIFKELRQSVTNDWGGVKPQVVEEDKEFLEKKEKLQDLELQLSNASQQAESLVKAQQDIGETMGELGLAFIKLTKFETEEAMFNSQRVRAANMKRVATAAVKASRFYREANAQTVKHLDALHEYLGLMLAVHGAFADRSSALLTVQTLLSDLSSLHSRAEKLEAASSKIFGGDKSRIRKIEELKETIKVTKDAKMCAIREYERIKENNRSELERFDMERQNDFLNMLRGFVVNQVGYAEKIANVWDDVAEETSEYTNASG